MLAALFKMIANRRLRNKGNLKEWQKLLPVITIALTEGWQKKKIFFMYKKRKNNHFYINALHRRLYKRAVVFCFLLACPALTIYPARAVCCLSGKYGMVCSIVLAGLHLSTGSNMK